MGRWAQQHRRGGGGTPPATCLTITAATISNPNTALVTLSGNIAAAGLNPANWQSTPDSNSSPDSIDQFDTNILQLNFTPDISLDTDIQYAGAGEGICTPQVLEYT